MQFSSFSFQNLFQDDLTVFHHEVDSLTRFSQHLCKLLPSTITHDIIFVCIGTDRSTGDSLGPLVGTFLEESDLKSFHFYGTLDDPIHALNLQERLDFIQSHYTNPFIVGIDACLGKMKNISSIRIAKGPVKPGAALNKKLPEVGHIHLTGVVNISGFMDYLVLQNTRLSVVMKMAKFIAKGIKETENKLLIK
jgi:putative sporulation protein YyaC